MHITKELYKELLMELDDESERCYKNGIDSYSVAKKEKLDRVISLLNESYKKYQEV